jgi:hypothetical protein
METNPEVILSGIDLLAEHAGTYFDAAELALEVAHIYTQDGPLHAEFFALSGLSLPELQALGEYGADLIGACLNTDDYLIDTRDHRPVQLATKYTAINTEVVLDPNEVANRKALVQKLAGITVDLEGADVLFDECIAAIETSPSKSDLQVVVGLAVVRLTQTLSREDIQGALQDSDSYPDFLRGVTPFMQAAFMVSACIGIDEQSLEGVGYLEECFDKTLSDEQLLGYLKSSLSEARIISPLIELMVADGALMEACLPVAGAAVGIAAESSARIIKAGEKSTQSLAIDASEQDVLSALDHETYVAEITRSLARRAKSITEDVKSIYRLKLRRNMPFDMTPLPVAGTPLSQLFHDVKVEQVAEAIATRRSIQQEAEQHTVQAITEIRGRYFMSHKAVKNHPAGSSLTRMLYSGEGRDNNFHAIATSKETSFALAGLMFTISQQLETVDNTQVFDRFFESVATEIEHTRQLNGSVQGLSLESLAEWLQLNQNALIASNIPVLKAVGRGIRQYQAERTNLEDQSANNRQLVS